MRAKINNHLNVRLVPSIEGNKPIGILRPNQEVEIKGIQGDWLIIDAYIHKNFVKILNEMEPTYSKIGHHIMAGQRDITRILDHFKIMFEKGKPIAGCTILFVGDVNTNLPEQIKKVSPSTIIVGRIYSSQEPNQVNGSPHDPNTWANGRSWFLDRLPFIQSVPYVDYWALTNEWGTQNMPSNPTPEELPKYINQAKIFADFFIDMMLEANKQKIKITVGDLGVGQIESYAIPELRRMLMVAEKFGHPLAYHAYNGNLDTPITDGFGHASGKDYWYARRYQQWVDGMPNLQIILTEAGAGDAKYSGNPELEVQYMNELDNIVKNDNVLFFSWWSLSPHDDWLNSNYIDALSVLEQ